jgi:hypothetical protein
MRKDETMKTLWMRRLSFIGWLLRKGGPYLALELLLPGGTLLAILLFLYQRRNAAANRGGRDAVDVLRHAADAASDWIRAGLQPAMAGARTLARARAMF